LLISLFDINISLLFQQEKLVSSCALWQAIYLPETFYLDLLLGCSIVHSTFVTHLIHSTLLNRKSLLLTNRLQ